MEVTLCRVDDKFNQCTVSAVNEAVLIYIIDSCSLQCCK